MEKQRFYLSVIFAIIMYISYIVRDVMDKKELVDSITSLKNISLTVICCILFYFITKVINSIKKK
jgi:hypothetical protein